ncbi:AAA family ATPase, partial [Streptomyces xiaopingdaonensis]|uniref:HelD family protein n=1 Tax=Streptomyces xiaopingdaonensis TaxID=1565415 RepID=UPI000998440B
MSAPEIAPPDDDDRATAQQSDEGRSEPTPSGTAPPPVAGDRALTPPTDALSHEQKHLARARAALRAMRQDTESLNISDVATNWVNAAVLARDIDARVASLADLPGSPLFFGRIDFLHGYADIGDRFYIGRRHVHDTDGDPLVVDWRAPVSRPFYSASKTDPMDVSMRRRFGYTNGDLSAYEDEHLTDPSESAHSSALLQAEIERPRVGPMRDIVATIQPEQDTIVRTDVDDTVCVQGAPGTGKTAVGLHRVAYLLYAHRKRLARTGTLVVGPNDSFLHYIAQVLPSLGESEVRQATVDELTHHALLTSGGKLKGTESAASAKLKGDARMAEVLRRAVYSGVRKPEEPLVVSRGIRRWRIPVEELSRFVDELLERGFHYNAGREALPLRVGHAILTRVEKTGETADSTMERTVTRNVAVKAFVNSCWPAVDPAKLVLRLLSEPAFLAEHADGIFTAEEQKEILWETPGRGVRSAKWSGVDAVLVDEATSLVARSASVGHLVLDEAQDLSAMEYRALGRRCATGTATILGDLAQGTTPWATTSWEEAMRHLGKPGAVVEELTDGFRVPREVIAYASRLLPQIAPTLKEATSIRDAAGRFAVRERSADELDAAVVEACREALAHEGTVGLIASDDRIPALTTALRAAGLTHLAPGEDTSPQTRLTLAPAPLTKGLEYDYVVLDEPAAVVAAEPDPSTGLRRLYVALTRAVSGLTVVHSAPLPEALR